MGEPEPLGRLVEKLGRTVPAAAQRPRPAPAPPPAADRAADAAQARQAVLLARWERTVPPNLTSARLDHLEGQEGGAAVARWALGPPEPELTSPAVPPWREGWNLLLLGATGVGKSHAAVAAAREVVRAGHGCLYWSVPELLAAAHWDQEGHEGVLRRAQEVPVLLLDDFGAEGPNEWTQRVLYRLLEARCRDRRATIGTTNLEPDDLEEALGPRSFSRLVGGAIVVRFVGDDRRRARP